MKKTDFKAKKKEKPKPCGRKPGAWKGKVIISPDFDDPIFEELLKQKETPHA